VGRRHLLSEIVGMQRAKFEEGWLRASCSFLFPDCEALSREVGGKLSILCRERRSFDVETGSGPEGSRLTTYIRRPWGYGVEKGFENRVVPVIRPITRPTILVHIFCYL